MLNTTYTPKRALLKLLNPLKRLMDREASIKYIHYLMFFKYLSDQLEEHFTKIIENKNIMLFEAYEDEVYYDLFKKEAINNFGYFLDYDNLFNNILYENKDKRINIDNLSEAFNQISNTANSNIFKDVFDEIDLINQYKMLDDNIGYILLSSFESHTVNEMKEAVKALSGVDALVIDMRDNPGGLVDAAIDITNMFMNEATRSEEHTSELQSQ